MPCYHPVSAFMTKAGDVVFSELARYGDLKPFALPCGRCIGCRLRRSAEWADRCGHEAQLHDANCFVTLTYDDAHVPSDGSLNHRHFQDFMRRLRRRFGFRVSYYMCGEYGPELGRPHYHACLFGVDFRDRTQWKKSDGGEWTYRSAELDALWPFGLAVVQDFSWKAAAYAARYVCDKITGDLAGDHYGGRLPEYNRMSLRPGVGRRWFERFSGDLRRDYVVRNGREAQVPRYYDKLKKRSDPDGFAAAVEGREVRAAAQRHDNTPERRAVKEVVQRARVSTLKRGSL